MIGSPAHAGMDPGTEPCVRPCQRFPAHAGMDPCATLLGRP